MFTFQFGFVIKIRYSSGLKFCYKKSCWLAEIRFAWRFKRRLGAGRAGAASSGIRFSGLWPSVEDEEEERTHTHIHTGGEHSPARKRLSSSSSSPCSTLGSSATGDCRRCFHSSSAAARSSRRFRARKLI